MLTYPRLDPIALAIGPLKIHWYGITYLIGFAAAWWLGRIRSQREDAPVVREQMEDLIFFGALGVVLGGRIGYNLFYNLPAFLANPLVLLEIWKGGMSFHGGLLGVLLALWLFSRRIGSGFFRLADFVVPLVPIGLFCGRIGNFINAELWGGPTESALGMRVPCEYSPSTEELCERAGTADGLFSMPVHASQLYEAALEGIALFLILWLFSARARPVRAVSALFLICYGAFRFAVEFVRMPDSQLGFLAFDWLTMGQLLSLPMILSGFLLIFLAYRKREAT
ncbi:MAG: prolipoprotein diacylglyceryl transferase [Gammaproteobacteria bacterium RIFOXYA12_FULL_61_12]|nr:MAG: prolipoprotein diacylglyceryl transferase [Gammaproteobacteria bacterium RIFOXYA12_FULL_61_12]OGT91723.1 MAG: prolipoprotein diacylglyceryl transferase [Gammaproteobacteria bacterium RIFOXYD12_FULL_61_37]